LANANVILYSAAQTNSILGEGNWEPIWRVNSTAGEVSTIILVRNYGIRYPELRDDPIFPADSPLSNQYYFNGRIHAGVLGCIDRTTICSPNGSVCGSWKYWHGLGRSDTEDYRVQAALTWSLMYSNIGLAISFRLGNALDAMQKVSGVHLCC
jgi:hypothetical protein